MLLKNQLGKNYRAETNCRFGYIGVINNHE